MIRLYNIKISTMISLRYKIPPTDYKDILRSLEIIKDEYTSRLDDKEFIFFWLLFSGYCAKFSRELGNYVEYSGALNQVVSLYLDNITPEFPMTYEWNSDDSPYQPNCLISFHLQAHMSSVGPVSLTEYLISQSPSKYLAKKTLKLSILDNFPVKATINNGTVIISKRIS